MKKEEPTVVRVIIRINVEGMRGKVHKKNVIILLVYAKML